MSISDIDPLFLTVARISTYDDPNPNACEEPSYGTGFFYSNPHAELFLITNRHVIIDEEKGKIPNLVRLSLHANPNDLRVNRDYDIALYKVAKKLWREPDPFADVVAIPLDVKDIQGQGFILKSFSDVNLLQPDLRLQIGEDILVMGYPLGQYYDDVNNLPVLRNGMVASAYPVPYKGQPYFLIDARLHKGTSGSPVMTKSKRDWRKAKGGSIVGNFQFFLIGVNSSTWQLPEEEEPLGLSAAFFVSIVQDITR
jgi:S1-C subfamily serine protease